MKKYQLVVFKFYYTDNFACIWPVCFAINPQNNFGIRQADVIERAIADLQTYPGIKKVIKLTDKIADEAECAEILDYILKMPLDDDSVSIKYLELEEQTELLNVPRYDYESNSYYIPLQIRNKKFPVRVRAINFKFMLDDLELPLLVLKEQID